MSYNDMFQIDATLVANEFLDKYMPSANGDYVKVYLYLLRNHVNGVDVETAAEQLELTEGDVRRAINYWRKCGILSVASEAAAGGSELNNDNAKCVDAGEKRSVRTRSGDARSTDAGNLSGDSSSSIGFSAGCTGAELSTAGRAGSGLSAAERAGSGLSTAGSVRSSAAKACVSKQSDEPSASAGQNAVSAAPGADDNGEIRNRYRRTDGREALERLSSDDEFRQLLFIVQKYRSKILTESEEQVLAYLYDGLHIPCEVLDYLVQYCVENNHNSMRYIEKTGLDWAGAGIRTVKAAQQRTRAFDDRKKESVKKERTAKNKAGITRGKDLDSWLTQVVQSNI